MPNRTTIGRSVRSKAVGTMLYLIGAALFVGSVQARTTVKGTWQEGAPRKQSFSRVLVVGVSPNVNQRCAFEFFMTSQLKSDSVEVIRSCDAVKEKDPLTREVEMKEGGSRDTRGTASYKATDMGFTTGYYGMYGVPVIYGEFATAPAFTIAQGQAEVSSRFYQTRDKALIYTLDTKATKLESSDGALHDFAKAIADKLRREGLTR